MCLWCYCKRSWSARFNTIYLVRFGFHNVEDIDFKCFLLLKIRRNSKKPSFGRKNQLRTLGPRAQGHTSMNKVTYLFQTENMFALSYLHVFKDAPVFHIFPYLHHARWTGQIHLRPSLNLKPSMPFNGIYGIHGTNDNHIHHINHKRILDPSHLKAFFFFCQSLNVNSTC
jgi:hypothetical protein